MYVFFSTPFSICKMPLWPRGGLRLGDFTTSKEINHCQLFFCVLLAGNGFGKDMSDVFWPWLLAPFCFQKNAKDCPVAQVFFHAFSKGNVSERSLPWQVARLQGIVEKLKSFGVETARFVHPRCDPGGSQLALPSLPKEIIAFLSHRQESG